MDADITIFSTAAVTGKRGPGVNQMPATVRGKPVSPAWEGGRDHTQAALPPGTGALPLAIRMEGNAVNRSKMALDSPKLFFKGQMEEPGGEKVERSNKFILYLLLKHVRGNIPQNAN